ncbi:hypothetical protein INT45_012170 [Circinella minor]|uniref:F-box domain-containing protein n=1 Tax=Circinella minor TaxID=1195481 RepID=A0A8H7VR43_9FUNG|nr:hypothetical protein INT45_012170 [Circinella minor]
MESTKVRAGTGVQKGKYGNDELHEAWDMIASDPENSTRYLIAGHSYKEQRKQEEEEVINVLNMSLKQVSVTNKEYEALRQGKKEAESRKNKPIDILSQLPLEITHHIIDNYFDQKSIAPYSRVCSTWRNIILHHSKYWKRMIIEWQDITTNEENTLLPYMLLPSICQHVKEIEIFNEPSVAKLTKLFKTNNFSKFQSLKIIREYDDQAYPQSSISYYQFSSVLTAISKTLTNLSLVLGGNNTDLPNLSDIFNICGNLTTLRYMAVTDSPVFIPLTIAAQHKTSLKELEIFSACKEDKINSTELQKLLENSPYLSCLAIGNCDDTIYTAIQKHGKNINSLYIDHNILHNIRLTLFDLNDIPLDNNLPGLNYLGVHDIISPRSLLSFIKNHHYTLSYLMVDTERNTSHNDNDWEKLADVLSLSPLTNLTHLELNDLEADGTLVCRHILPTIITSINNIRNDSNQHISNLQCLHVLGEGVISNNVLDAITEMPKFTELNLMNCSFDSNKMHEILNIFEKRSDNNTTLTSRAIKTLSPPSSLLTVLHLNYIESGMNDTVVLTISRIKSLTDLNIQYHLDGNSTVCKTFVHNVSELPLLEMLEIGPVIMTMNDLKILTRSKTLCNLEITTVNNRTINLNEIRRASSDDHVV